MSLPASRRSRLLLPAAGMGLLALAFNYGAPADTSAAWSSLAAVFALLAPVGIALIAAAGHADQRAGQTALTALTALCLASICYLLVGFAFQFGGVGLVSSSPGLSRLIWEWSPLDREWGMGWGAIGLAGYALSSEASHPDAYMLFLSQLAPLSVAVLLPLLALRDRARPAVLLVSSLLVGAVLYPVAGNWLWGGGWLANLGLNLGLGHGCVDFGASAAHLTGAVTALAGLLVFTRPRPIGAPARMPPAHLPVLAVLGGFLFVPGWLAVSLADPLLASQAIAWPVVAVNLVLSAATAGLMAMLYTWFAAGSANILMGVRGMVAGLVAVSAAAPFVPPWAALFIGGVIGLLLPLAAYLFNQVLGLDEALIVPVHGLSAIWGSLALGLFADGAGGVGWNGIGAQQYLGVTGQGVAGLLADPRFLPDFPGQLYAQALGLAAITIFCFVLAWLAFKVVSHLARALSAGSGEPLQAGEADTAFAGLSVAQPLGRQGPPSP